MIQFLTHTHTISSIIFHVLLKKENSLFAKVYVRANHESFDVIYWSFLFVFSCTVLISWDMSECVGYECLYMMMNPLNFSKVLSRYSTLCIFEWKLVWKRSIFSTKIRVTKLAIFCFLFEQMILVPGDFKKLKLKRHPNFFLFLLIGTPYKKCLPASQLKKILQFSPVVSLFYIT